LLIRYLRSETLRRKVLKNSIYPEGMPKVKRSEISRKSGYIALASLRDSYREEYRSAVTLIRKANVFGTNITRKAMVEVSKAHMLEYEQLRYDSREILVTEWIATSATPEQLEVCTKALEERESPGNLIKEVPRKSVFSKLLTLVGLRNVN
jgi:hypothetical protein